MAKGNSEARTGWLLVSPPAVYTVLLLAAPLATVLIYSFLTGGKGEVGAPVTLQNYIDLFTQPVYRAVMWRSLTISLMVTATTVILAYPIAYFVSFHVSPSKKSLWLFLITIPFWTSYIIRVSLWRTILGYNGIVDSLLMGLGITAEPVNILSHGFASIVFTLSHAYAPFAVLPIFVSLEKVDRALLEAGQDLGETRWTTFLRVTLPLTMPGVIAAVLIVFIPTVGDYVTPELIGGGKTPMIANLIEVEMLKKRDQAMGSAIAVAAMLIVGVVSAAFVLANRRYLGGRK
ncbi:MAG: ABC transporter permease [Rhodobacteraceae bacterium]|jgi:spermidine/putrescine transport system permease protein|nr:ABC transporter permease [Paracoccaceae bacterium]